MENRSAELIDRFKRLKGERSNFESYWQSLHDYFYIEAQDVNKSYFAGNELTSDFLWDSTTLESADILASGFMSYLTPPTSKWFTLRHRNPLLMHNKDVQVYLDDVASEVHLALNRSNYYETQFVNNKASGVYGTSITFEEEDIEDDIRFHSVPVKQVCLVEDARGRVVEYYLEFEYTARQAASRWGRDALSTEMQNELDNEKSGEKKHCFLLFIAQRHRREIQKTNRQNMPIEALWIDVEGKKTVDVGGYQEWPAFTHRFEKRPSIVWGYSPAMKALPFARILNAIAKTNLRSMMKHTDPAVAIPDNAFLSPLNQNPRAINYYNPTKMTDASKMIVPFGNNGDPNIGMMAVSFYQQEVKRLMYNDVFLAFNQITKQMNNPEIMERINEKMTLLGSAVGREISDRINPTIIRTIGILSRRGRLPEPPDEILQDPNYEIDTVSQLAQAQRRSELNSLMTGLQIVGQMAQLDPSVLDKINPDKVTDEVWSVLGAPEKVFRDDSEIQAIRDARGKMAQAQMDMEMVNQGADVIQKGSQAAKNSKEAESVVS